jgi:bis(5'-nucleosyl)-tetraphosphatase (symmetrical)
MKRDIVIGDVHGCLEELNELVEKTGYIKFKDRLIIAGDVFDRGPYSVECLRKIKELGAILVLGNHDEKHLRYATHEQRKRKDPRYKNPMHSFSGQRKEIQDALNEQDLDFLRNAPIAFCLDEKWVVVHAGLERMPFHKQGKAVLRVRYIDQYSGLHSKLPGSWDQPPNSIYWADDWMGPENVIYGHAVHSLTDPKVTRAGPQSNPVVTLGIDTGCCFGGRMTAAIIIDGQFTEFIQVQAKKPYKAMTQNSHKE